MNPQARSARARIDLDALSHNLKRVRSIAPKSQVLAMVKADAYGHGLIPVSKILAPLADGLGVASVSEAVALRNAGISGRIVVMQGFKNTDEFEATCSAGLDLVIHTNQQLDQLERWGSNPTKPLSIWIKIDTGMHRLGFPPEEVESAVRRLSQLPIISNQFRFLTHFACADEPDLPMTSEQIRCFNDVTQGLSGEHSLCNSAGIMTRPDAHADWVRPGIMLYGASPFVDKSAASMGLRSVMTLEAPLLAIHQYDRDEPIGYGCTYICQRPMRVGVVAIGYGDGYPRHATNGTSVSINGQPGKIVGRVSMDMLTVDLGDIGCFPGDMVTLWGNEPSADDVARYAETISYELFCSAGSKICRDYI